MRLFAATLLAAALAAPAAADPTRAAPPSSSRPADIGQMASDDCAKARKLQRDCVLTITDGDEINGAPPGSTGTTVTALPGTRHLSLISIRRDFIQEILKTAEDL